MSEDYTVILAYFRQFRLFNEVFALTETFYKGNVSFINQFKHCIILPDKLQVKYLMYKHLISSSYPFISIITSFITKCSLVQHFNYHILD